MFMRKVCHRLASSVALAGVVAGLSLALVGLGAAPAEARRHHRALHRPAVHHAAVAGTATAAIVVDGATGRMIWGMNENAPRHPASVTKVMTLYLLFEQLEKGRIALDDEIPVSAHAAAQAPSKLGLPPGRTIRVEDAIKAVVTKSANDIAVAIAEAVGGSESDFAQQMTRKANALGMSRTVYRNASGLPDPQQITTAADLAVLGRSIQARFPRYYRYFSLHEFAWRGKRIANHNHLMERCEGMDGIKTGYTVASGFNLLSSVKRDGHYIVAAVMGGKSARSRDVYMEALIERHIDEGGSPRAVSRVAEAEDPAPANAFNWWGGRQDDQKPAEQKPAQAQAQPEGKIANRAYAPAESPRLQVAAVVPEARPRPAYVSASAQARAETDEDSTTAAIPRRAADGSTAKAADSDKPAAAKDATKDATATPRSTRFVTGPVASDLRAAIRFNPPAKTDAKADAKVAEARLPETRPAEGKIEARIDPRPAPKAEAKAEAKVEAKPDADTSSAPRQAAGGKPPVPGWMIQIGATDDADKANALLAKAKSQRAALLASAHAYTEIVRKGNGTLYRARFAGLEESRAEAACKALKTSGFSCFATRN